MTAADVDKAAQAVLTPRQLQAYRLWADGLGYRRIGAVLGVSSDAARLLLDRARLRLRKERPDVRARRERVPGPKPVTCRCACCGEECHGALEETRVWFAEHRGVCAGRLGS